MGSLLPMLESVYSIYEYHFTSAGCNEQHPKRFSVPSFKDLTTYMGMLTPGATELFGGGLIPP